MKNEPEVVLLDEPKVANSFVYSANLRFQHSSGGQRVAGHEVLFQAQVFDDELLAVGRVLARVVSEHLLDAAVVRVLSSRVASSPKGPARA